MLDIMGFMIVSLSGQIGLGVRITLLSVLGAFLYDFTHKSGSFKEIVRNLILKLIQAPHGQH